MARKKDDEVTRAYRFLRAAVIGYEKGDRDAHMPTVVNNARRLVAAWEQRRLPAPSAPAPGGA